MIPKLIQQTAPTHRLTWEEARLTRRLRKMMPDWDYRLWSNDEQETLFAETFPDLIERFRRIPYPMGKADVARYAILYRHGGFYFDTDYKLLRPIDDDWLASSMVIPVECYWPDKGSDEIDKLDFGSAILGSEAANPFWRDLVENIFANNAPDGAYGRQDLPIVTGPMALTHFYVANRARYPNAALPERDLFLPQLSLFGLRSTAHDKTVGIHLTFGSWRQASALVKVKVLARRKLNGLLA